MPGTSDAAVGNVIHGTDSNLGLIYDGNTSVGEGFGGNIGRSGSVGLVYSKNSSGFGDDIVGTAGEASHGNSGRTYCGDASVGAGIVGGTVSVCRMGLVYASKGGIDG